MRLHAGTRHIIFGGKECGKDIEPTMEPDSSEIRFGKAGISGQKSSGLPKPSKQDEGSIDIPKKS